MSSKGCGTCKDRKIACDRAYPTCLHCTRSKRTCQGYGTRLSWPKKNDAKRSHVGKAPRSANQTRTYDLSDSRLINITSFDMDLYHHLAVSRSNVFKKRVYIPSSINWNPLELGRGQLYLIDYFKTTASRYLRTWDHDPSDVGNIILRMALANESPYSAAVLQSLLALSSLRRHGLHVEAANLRISALRALANASTGNLNKDEAKQHIAAGMLLYSLEILDVSSSLNQWTWHIAGVKDVLKAASFDTSHCDSEFATLLEWAYYHDLLARFSIWHYRIDDNVNDRLSGPLVMTNTKFCFKEPLEISPLRPASFLILELLINVCQAIFTRSAKSKSGQGLADYNAYLQSIHCRIRKMELRPTNCSECNSFLIMELYQLATLIYIEKATQNTLYPAKETRSKIERGFEIFSQLPSCDRLLPVFILGCEARTDEERIIVLDLLARGENSVVSRCTILLLNVSWAQDDLAERELVYLERMGAVISSCDIMMTFI